MEGAAPAEAAAEVDLVDLALVERQPGRLGGGLQRRLAVLGRAPDLAALRVHSAVAFIGSMVAWFWNG